MMRFNTRLVGCCAFSGYSLQSADISMRLFTHVLVNTMIANTASMFVWFALTYFAYLETRSVLVTSVLAGLYMVMSTLSSIFFGGLVDHHKKKDVMIWSSIGSLVFFLAGFGVLAMQEQSAFGSAESPILWYMATLLLLGTICGNLRMIALSTQVTIMVPPEGRDKANGLVGIVNGVTFSLTAVLSGFAIAYAGMTMAVAMATVATLVALLHVWMLDITETLPPTEAGVRRTLDVRGTIAVILLIPGLVGLLVLNVINNVLGGVFMSLMDAYGLSLVSVSVWGALWGALGFGFIVGGIYVSRYGLGTHPLRTMLIANLCAWAAASVFTLYPSITLMAFGILVWMVITPVVEASEHTVLQKVVPLERQGRVFGFAQSTESAITPLTAFCVGPFTELWVIPFMASSSGVALFGGWFGTTPDRAMALVFTVSSLMGLLLTLLAFRTRAYRNLSRAYEAQG